MNLPRSFKNFQRSNSRSKQLGSSNRNQQASAAKESILEYKRKVGTTTSTGGPVLKKSGRAQSPETCQETRLRPSYPPKARRPPSIPHVQVDYQNSMTTGLEGLDSLLETWRSVSTLQNQAKPSEAAPISESLNLLHSQVDSLMQASKKEQTEF